MTESILSNNLAQLMKTHGNISVSELARLTEIPQPTIHHILSGTTKNPRKKALEALAQFFSVTIEQLSGDCTLPVVIPESVKANLHLKSVPIIEWNMLSNWPAPVSKGLPEVLLERTVGKDSFALKIENEEMEPMFPKNSLLIFDSDKPPQDRDFVVAFLEKEERSSFNRIFKDNQEKFLKQNLTDGNMKLIKLDPSSDRILGTLIEVRIQY